MKSTLLSTVSLFNELNLLIAVVTCPPPENIDKGYLSNNEQRDFDFMETVKYGCHGDFVLEGSLQIVCQKDGHWSEKPSCKGRTKISFSQIFPENNWLNKQSNIMSLTQLSDKKKKRFILFPIISTVTHREQSFKFKKKLLICLVTNS